MSTNNLENVIDLLAETVEEFNTIGGGGSECQDTGLWKQMPDPGVTP